jgi:pimeloyl-ACP methyl ester carboxylesterase
MQICFLHGLDSSPQGTKSRLLKKHYPDCLIPELPPDLEKRIDIVEREIQSPMVIVGSSLGGLTAIMFAMKHPLMVKGMVLMAPAVGVRDKSILSDPKIEELFKSIFLNEKIPTSIIAGLNDDVIPIEDIRSLVQRSPLSGKIDLIEVEDDHNLHQSLDLMLDKISLMLKHTNKE